MTTKKPNWRSDVLSEVTDECLKCIKKAELNRKEPATPGKCIDRTHWKRVPPRERVRCGSYSIFEDYYSRCSDKRQGYNVTGNFDWKSCALNEECSTNCVRNYVNFDREVTCHRGKVRDRLCIDYGIIHAYGADACALRKEKRNIERYARLMMDTCNVKDSSKRAPDSRPPGVNLAAVISPIAATLIIILIIIGVVLFIRRRKQRLRLPNRAAGDKNSNNYGGVNYSAVYDIKHCSDDIQNMVRQHLISIADIDIQEEIGRGQFGVIRRAICYTDADHTQHITVAVKIIKDQSREKNEEEVKNLLREADIMSQFDHANVLNLIGVIWERGETPAVVCPYMGKGSLLDIIKKSEIKFLDVDLLNFVVQIAAGLEYLEAMKFVHRDIALRNCLVSDLYIVKISDFGLTRDIYDSRIYECTDVAEKRLPWKWLAIECIREGSFTHKSDVWSYGVTIWELFTNGSSPYPAIGNLSVLQDCLEAGYRLAKPDKLSQQLYDLMRLMWIADPANRPSFAELHATIKRLSASESQHNEYSYTSEPRRSPLPDYLRPVASEPVTTSCRDSRVYADTPLQQTLEPDIY